jgi:type I restriction enzyme, S subunit
MKKAWPTKKLGDVCATIQDGAHESPKVQFDSPGKGRFLYITSKNIRNNYLDLENVSYVEETFHNRIYPRCKPGVGDVLLTKDGANTGNVTLNTIDEPFSLLSSVCLIKTKPDALKPSFLSYYIQSPIGLKSITGQMTGAAIKRIILRDIKLAEIPLPPVAEQQRIVGLLDEAFAGLATAKANAEKNLQNARALFESHLQSVFTQRGKGWVEKRLGDITAFKNGLNFNRESKGQTLRIVGVGDFQDHSVVPIETLQCVTIDGEIDDDYLIRRDDILTVRSNGSKDLVGRCMLVPDVDETTSFSGFIIRLRFNTREISPRFLLHFLKSSATRERLTRDGGGANISNINQAKLSELPISLPPFKQQEEIAGRLDDVREETERLARIYEQKLAALDELKKSLLHQAFTGNL